MPSTMLQSNWIARSLFESKSSGIIGIIHTTRTSIVALHYHYHHHHHHYYYYSYYYYYYHYYTNNVTLPIANLIPVLF